MHGDELRQFWTIPEPWSIAPITQGVNNLTQVIETPTKSYILRSYRSDRSLGCLVKPSQGAVDNGAAYAILLGLAERLPQTVDVLETLLRQVRLQS